MKNNSTEIDTMREEYDINALNPRKNPYAGRLKRPITINVNNKTIDYFKEMVSKTGIPYQNWSLFTWQTAPKRNENQFLSSILFWLSLKVFFQAQSDRL